MHILCKYETKFFCVVREGGDSTIAVYVCVRVRARNRPRAAAQITPARSPWPSSLRVFSCVQAREISASLSMFVAETLVLHSTAQGSPPRSPARGKARLLLTSPSVASPQPAAALAEPASETSQVQVDEAAVASESAPVQTEAAVASESAPVPTEAAVASESAPVQTEAAVASESAPVPTEAAVVSESVPVPTEAAVASESAPIAGDDATIPSEPTNEESQ